MRQKVFMAVNTGASKIRYLSSSDVYRYAYDIHNFEETSHIVLAGSLVEKSVISRAVLEQTDRATYQILCVVTANTSKNAIRLAKHLYDEIT